MAERLETRRLNRAAARIGLTVLLAMVLGLTPGAWAQATTANAAAAPATVTGRVLDGLHGTPIPRALVNMGSRRVMTDALGRFSFPSVTDARVYLSASKPGFATENQSLEGTSATLVSDPTVSTDLVLFPDGVIAGVVTGPDGEPVAGASVRLARANYGATGLAAVQAGYGSTDAEGEYRFREPAGAYRVLVGYVPSAAETGESILPVESPNGSTGNAAGYWTLTPGQERRVDLRAGGGMPLPVTLRVTGARAGGDERHGGVRVIVHMGSGASFSTGAVGTGEDGHYQMTLPPGSYRIQVVSGGRDEVLEGSSRVTVGRKEPAAAEIALAPFTSLPIEIATVVSASGTVTPGGVSAAPNVPQLNLMLHAVEGGEGASGLGGPFDSGGDDVRPQERAGGGGYEFRVPAGRYLLTGTDSAAGWTVTGASYGVANLLGEELEVADGSGGTPIRVTVSNATGQIAATVNLGPAAGGWVYVIPDAPRLAPETVGRVGLTGVYNAKAAPGTYTLVAVAHRLQLDFHDPKAMARLKSAGSKVEVADGGKATAQLDLHKVGEVTR